MDIASHKTICEIIQAITAAGYDPYSQLYGYITTGKEEYITRSGNAREIIKKLNRQELKKYMDEMKRRK